MKACFLLQGPIYSTSIEKLKLMCDNQSNIIISTWKDSNIEYLKILESIGCYIVLNDKPAYNGTQNVNLANVSICNGLIKAKELGYTHALRFRTDWIINDYNKYINICLNLSHNKLVFLTWFHHNNPQHPNGYLMDHIIFGPIDLLYNYRNVIQNENDRRCTEIFLQEEYFKKRNLKLDDVRNDIKICFKDVLDSGIKIYRTKPRCNMNEEFMHSYNITNLCELK